MGSVGVTQPPMSPPKPCRGHQSQQDRDCCCCAQGTASLWQFCISPPETSTFPLLLIPGKAWEALLHPAVLPFPENSYWEFQHFSHPPSRKHHSFFFPPWESHWCWDSPPCMMPWQWLALLPTRMLPGCNPPCQQLQKAPRCPGRPFTCWLLTNKNTRLLRSREILSNMMHHCSEQQH